MKEYLLLRVNSTSSASTPYNFISTTSLCLTVEVQVTRLQIILSMISATPSPSFNFWKYSQAPTSFRASFPMFCMYSARTSNSFYSLANRFSVNLASTLTLQASEVLAIMTRTILRQFSSMSICSSISLPLRPCLRMMGKMYFSPPKSMNSSIINASMSASMAVKELAMVLRACTPYSLLALMNCSMTSLPFIWWQTILDFSRSSEPLMSMMLRQSKRFPRYSPSSLLLGTLDRKG